MAKNATFSGYEVPKGTYVVTQNQVSCRLKQFCPIKPNEFWPTRYLDDRNAGLHYFLSKPFGHGPRICVGRFLAIQSMKILLFRLAQAFYFNDLDQSQIPIDCVFLGVNQPVQSVPLKMMVI